MQKPPYADLFYPVCLRRLYLYILGLRLILIYSRFTLCLFACEDSGITFSNYPDNLLLQAKEDDAFAILLNPY